MRNANFIVFLLEETFFSQDMFINVSFKISYKYIAKITSSLTLIISEKMCLSQIISIIINKDTASAQIYFRRDVF